jgi:hypothetical protein
LAAALLLACGGSGLSYVVADKKLDDMSRQGQLWVYDAENEIVVALDQLDEARDELRDIRYRIEKADKSVKRADKRGKPLGVEVAEAWLEYLEDLETWAEAQVKWRRLGVILARATVELAKAQVIQREDLLGGKDFDLADYREQYADFEQAMQKRGKRLAALRKKARRKEVQWWRIRHRFVAQTGDYDSGLWID